MSTRSLRPVLDELDYLLLEAAEKRNGGITLHIVHRYQKGAACLDGEEIAMVLVGTSRKAQVLLSPVLRFLIDFLARSPHRYLDATQIALGLRGSFYARHGANIDGKLKRPLRPHRTAIKMYISRTRKALALALSEAGVHTSSADILRSEKLSNNSVGYSLRAAVQWWHE